MTIHRVFRCLITSQRLTDSWSPHTVVHLVTRATLGICCGRGKWNLYHQRSSRKDWSCQCFMRARLLSFRLASRAGDGSDPAFSHLCLLPALPDRRAWAPLSWTGRLTPGVSVAWLPAMFPGRAGWVRLHKGPNRILRLLFRIRLHPSKPLRHFAFELPRPLLPRVDCSSPLQ